MCQFNCLEPRYVYTYGCLFSGPGHHEQIRDCRSKKVTQIFSISFDHTTDGALTCRHCLKAFLALTGVNCSHSCCFFHQ